MRFADIRQTSVPISSQIRNANNESYPGVFQPFGGFADDTPVESGYVWLPDAPGIGMELKAELWKICRSL